MLERIVARLALAMFDWIEKRAERGSTAIDADRDGGSLRRAGTRLRLWMLKNRVGK